MNPMSMFKMFMSKNKDPKEILKNYMLQDNSNPMLKNLIEMVENGNTKGVEQFARNLFEEKGKSFDEEFANFMNQIR